MSFFAAPPPPEQPPRFEQPEWFGPPENVLPASFPLDELVARADGLALAVHNGRAYANGITFSFEIRRREPRNGRRDDPIMRWHESYESSELPPDVLRFGVELADGRKATVFDRPRFLPDGKDTPPPEIALVHRGGGGGMHHWDLQFWLWPLPPAGLLAFVVEWPSEGLALTRVEVDTAPIKEAAARATELWPGADSESGGGWTSSSRIS